MSKTLPLALVALALALLSPSLAPAQDKDKKTYDVAKLANFFREHGKDGSVGQELWSSKVSVNGEVKQDMRYNRVSTKESADTLKIRYVEIQTAGKRESLDGVTGSLVRTKGTWAWKPSEGKPPAALIEMMKTELKDRNKKTSVAWTLCLLAPKTPLAVGGTWNADLDVAAKVLEIPFKNHDTKASFVKGKLKAARGKWIDVEMTMKLVYPERKMTVELLFNASLPLGPNVNGHVEGTATISGPGQSITAVQRLERGTLK
jgi:hypothetical protein